LPCFPWHVVFVHVPGVFLPARVFVAAASCHDCVDHGVALYVQAVSVHHDVDLCAPHLF
jgi:hypothetical protein